MRELVLQSQTYVFTALELLLARSIDLAFARLPIPHPDLAWRVVEVEELLCALPAGHQMASRDSIRLSELHDEDFVSLPDNQSSILQSTMYSLCVTAGFRPRIAQIAPDSSTVLALVAAGAGVTITLSSVSAAQTVGIAYRPLDNIPPSHMFATLVWRKADPSPALQHVLDGFPWCATDTRPLDIRGHGDQHRCLTCFGPRGRGLRCQRWMGDRHQGVALVPDIGQQYQMVRCSKRECGEASKIAQALTSWRLALS